MLTATTTSTPTNNPSTPAVIEATCRNCDTLVFVGLNSWIRVTRTYYLPAIAGSYKLCAVDATEQPRPASNGTDLSECQIQPLSCSSCHETLGILCTDTPISKSHLNLIQANRLREFIKLSKLTLIDRKTGAEVDPQFEQAMLDEHRSDKQLVGNLVDGELRQSGSPAVGVGSRDSLLPPVAETIQRSASPIQLPSISQQHPPPQDDFIAQLQTTLQSQLHVHSQILEEQRQELESQRRNIARIDSAIEALHHEQRNIFTMIDDIRLEVRSRASATENLDTSEELDILAKEIQSVAAKANEVAGLKMQLDLMRSQLRRMERHGSPVGNGVPSVEPSGHEQMPPAHAQPPTAQFVSGTPSQAEPRSLIYQTPTDTRLPAPIVVNSEPHPMAETGEPRMLPGFRSIDPASSTSTISSWRPAGGFAAQAPAPAVAPAPQVESPAAASGWAAVNSNSAPKRTLPESAPPYESPIPGSPKRQRLAPLMPRTSYDQQNPAGASSPYHANSTDTLPTVPSLIASRNPSNDSVGSVPPPSNGLRFVQFASASEASPEEAWRQDAARSAGPLSDRGRGSPRRGRGGGRGRGGRKSGGGEGDRGTPEWDQPEYAPNGYYGEGRGGLVRRGGHATAPTERPNEAQHAAGMFPDPHFMPITTTADVASSSVPTKKTRTKPVRNSEGILIRKDGRPDMRSVSSAMNLKKVHAKKEAERAGSTKEPSADQDRSEHTPRSTSDHDGNETNEPSPSTPSLNDRSTTEVDNPQDRRHQENMRKIFPYGIESETVTSVAQQFFPKPDDNRVPEVKIEAVGEADVGRGKEARQTPDQPQQQASRKQDHHHDGSKPLIDGEKSMVHHAQGRVDIEMSDAN